MYLWNTFLFQMRLYVPNLNPRSFFYHPRVYTVPTLTLLEYIARCTPKGKCLRNPPCELWDEDMLLAAEERQREGARAAAAVEQPIMHHVGIAFVAQNQNQAPPPYAQHHHNQPQPAMDLEWMDDPSTYSQVMRTPKCITFTHFLLFVLVFLY